MQKGTSLILSSVWRSRQARDQCPASMTAVSTWFVECRRRLCNVVSNVVRCNRNASFRCDEEKEVCDGFCWYVLVDSLYCKTFANGDF